MDANTWIQLISNLGFPICCVIGLALYVRSMTNNFRTDMKEMTDDWQKSATEVNKTLQENRELILQLKTELNGNENDV